MTGVSLVICTRNRPDLLTDTVASILAGEELPDEIVIVDQSDSEHPVLASGAAVEGCELRYLHAASRGVSRARNEGARAARHPLLVFTDDDVLVTPGWLGTLVGALRESGPDSVVTGRVLPAGGERRGYFAPALRPGRTPAAFTGRVRSDPLISISMALPREVYHAVGGFDERLGPGTRFPAADDSEFGHRLLEAGYRVVYAPDALLYHQAWRTEGEYVRQRWGYGRGTGGFYAKHLSLRNGHMLRRLVGTVVRVLLRSPGHLWTRSSRPGRQLSRTVLARGDVALALGVLSGVREWRARYGRAAGHAGPEPI